MVDAKGPEAQPLRSALAACRGALLVLAAFSALINLLMLTAPLYMLQVFDRVLTSRSTDTLAALTLIAVVALATFGLLEGLRGVALVKLGGWLDRRLGRTVLEASIAGGPASGRPRGVQGLRDLDSLRSFIGGPQVLPLMDAPWTPLFVGVIFVLSPLLGWLSVAGAVILVALAVAGELATRALLSRAGAGQIEALRRAESAARNADVIEAMGMLDDLSARWARRQSAARAEQAAAGERGAAISAASRFVRLTLQIGVLGVGAWLVLDNRLTPGGMLAASILLGRALAPVDQAIGSWKATVGARDAWRRLERQLDGVLPRASGTTLPRPAGTLRCEGVAYGPPDAAKLTLTDVSFELPAGHALGIIGPTASGKTTLARLLVGTLRPRLGHVRLDGMDIAAWPSRDRGRHVGYLPQDVELFAGTVRENIARMGDGADEAVVEAARLAGAHELILRLPKGYETPVGDAGAALSGGQRQRIGLARAVYGNPALVVLDEPSANLDQSGLEALLGAVAALRARGTTLVLVAHQPSVVQQVDYVVALGDGTVALSGPREAVIARVTGPSAAAPVPREGHDTGD